MWEVGLVSRIVVGSVLLVAGIAKWRTGPNEFARAIRGYRLLPAAVPLPIARLLPLAEMVIGGALIVGWALPLAALGAALLLTVFAIAMASALARGFAPDCGCATSRRPKRVSWTLVYRNLALSASLPLVAGESAAATLAIALVSLALLLGVHMLSVHGARTGARALRTTGERT